MLYPDGRRVDHWRRGQSVPDVSRPETKLWFYFLAASYIDVGIEAIHFGQIEMMNGNDRDLAHWSQVLSLVRAYAAKHARRHMVLCDAHVPERRAGARREAAPGLPLVPAADQGGARQAAGGGPGGRVLRRHLRPQQGRDDAQRLVVRAPALPGGDRQLGREPAPGRAAAGGIWVWGYDEITWFAHQPEAYRAEWLRYAWDWVRKTDPDRPPPDARQPHRAIAAGRHAVVLRQPPGARRSPMALATRRRSEPYGPPNRNAQRDRVPASPSRPRTAAAGAGEQIRLEPSVSPRVACNATGASRPRESLERVRSSSTKPSSGRLRDRIAGLCQAADSIGARTRLARKDCIGFTTTSSSSAHRAIAIEAGCAKSPSGAAKRTTYFFAGNRIIELEYAVGPLAVAVPILYCHRPHGLKFGGRSHPASQRRPAFRRPPGIRPRHQFRYASPNEE